MNIDWNVCPINGQQSGVFFSRDSYQRFSTNATQVLLNGTEELDQDLDIATDDSSSIDISISSTELSVEEDDEGSTTQVLSSSCLRAKDETNVRRWQSAEQNETATAVVEKTSPSSASSRSSSNVLGFDDANLHLNTGHRARAPYPRRSFLTRSEQQTYNSLFDRFHNCAATTPEEGKQLIHLRELQLKVAPEQEEYMVYLEKAARLNPEVYSYLHPEANKFVEMYLEAGRKNVLHYPRYYTQHDTVSLAVGKQSPNIALQHVCTLLEMGTVPMVTVSYNLDSKHGMKKLPLDAGKVAKRSRMKTKNVDFKRTTDKKVISEDTNANNLAVKHRVDIATTYRALQCLVDNHAPSYEHQWELAVVVRAQYSVNENGQKIEHKVVYLDKPFVPKAMTQVEKNLLYHRSALKIHLLNVGHKKCHSFQTNGNQPNNNLGLSLSSDDETVSLHSDERCIDRSIAQEPNIFGESVTDIDKFEIFGTKTADNATFISNRRDAVKATPNSSYRDQISDPLISILQSCNSNVVVHNGNPVINGSTQPTSLLSTFDSASDESQDSESMTIDLQDIDRPPTPIVSLDGLTDEKDKRKAGYSLRSSRFKKADSKLKQSDLKLVESKGGSDESKDRSNPLGIRRSRRISNRRSLDVSTGTDSESEEKLVMDCSIEDTKSPTSGLRGYKRSPRRQTAEVVGCRDFSLNKPVENNGGIPASVNHQSSSSYLGSVAKVIKVHVSELDISLTPLLSSSALSCPSTATDNVMLNEDLSISVENKISPRSSNVIVKQDPDSPSLLGLLPASEDGVHKSISNETCDIKNNDFIIENLNVVPLKLELKIENVQPNGSKSSAQEVADHGSIEALRDMCPLDKILRDQSLMFINQSSLPSCPPSQLSKGTAMCDSVKSRVASVSTSAVHSQQSSCLSNVDQAVDISSESSKRHISDTGPEEMVEDAALFEQPLYGNVGYHLWRLDDLKLLIRQRHHGVNKPARRRHGFFVHLVPKLEYQPENGVEVSSVREMSANWFALHLKRNTQVLRARVNAFTSEIMLVETFNENLLPKLNTHSSVLSILHAVLEKVKRLDYGTYLLGHTAGSGHLQIKKNTKSERGVYDLHMAYSGTTESTKVPPVAASSWLPIDPTIRLPYHIKRSRVPCTFEPKDAEHRNESRKMPFKKKNNKRQKL